MFRKRYYLLAVKVQMRVCLERGIVYLGYHHPLVIATRRGRNPLDRFQVVVEDSHRWGDQDRLRYMTAETKTT